MTSNQRVRLACTYIVLAFVVLSGVAGFVGAFIQEFVCIGLAIVFALLAISASEKKL